MTFEQAFEKLSKKFLKKSGGVSDFNAEVCLTDDDCKGTFSIRVADGKVSVEPYDYYEADVRISCTYENFVKFISDQEATYDMQCKSKRFADIMAVAKKTNVKKEEEKKPAKSTEKKTASKNAEVKDKTEIKSAEKADESKKRTTSSKTAAKKVSSEAKVETPKIIDEVKPAKSDKIEKTVEAADKAAEDKPTEKPAELVKTEKKPARNTKKTTAAKKTTAK